LRRSADQFPGEGARHGEQRGAEPKAAEETTAVLEKEVLVVHIDPSDKFRYSETGHLGTGFSKAKENSPAEMRHWPAV
jgi:hypothetical protein